VYLANHTFRGVVVPAGSHLVSFRFQPDDLYTGLYLSAAAAAALAVYGAFLLFRLRRRRAGEDPVRTEPEGGSG
jgi:hypothetical protein